jgi:hypothetical protein
MAGIEGVDVGIAGFVDGIQHGRQLGQLGRGAVGTTLGSEELRGNLAGLLLGDGVSKGYYAQQATKNKNKVFPYHKYRCFVCLLVCKGKHYSRKTKTNAGKISFTF